MYNITKNVINSGRYELTDMLRKIDVLWLQKNLTDAEREELISLARSNADYEKTVDLYEVIEDLDNRLKVLEDKNPSEATEEWAIYIPGKMYHKGDKISFMGKHYTCVCEKVCMLSPLIKPDWWILETV